MTTRTEPAPRARDAATMSPRRLVGVLVVAVVGFAFQQTSIVPAVQTVQRSLGGSSEWSAWLVTVYLIVATVATPAMGRLGDLYGRRRLLLIGLSIFVLGSVAATFAPDMPVLILCRAVQGVGGSVYPLSLAIARAVLPAERTGTSIALLTGAFGVGTAVGFVAGGLLAQYASWRWIFAAGAVIVAAGTLLIWRVLPDPPERATGGFDRAGTGVLTVAVIGLLTALTLVVPFGWTSPLTILLFVVAAAAFAGWMRLETRRADPLVDVHVLREPAVAVANLAAIGLGWALFSSYLLVPQFAETDPHSSGFGLAASVSAVGLIMLPLALGQTALATTASWLSARVGARWVFAGGMAGVAASLALLALVRGSIAATAALLFLLGAGAGAALEASSEVTTEGVGEDVAAVSSAVNSTVRRLAGGVGGQVSTILLAVLVIPESGQPSRTAYVTAYLAAAAMSLCGATLVAFHRAGRREGTQSP